MTALSLAAIDSLPASQRRAIYDRLHHQFSPARKAYQPTQAEADVWAAICDALGMKMPLTAFVASFTQKRFRECSEAIHSYVLSGCRVAPRRQVLTSLTQVAVGCLAKHLGEGGRTVSPTRLLNEMFMLGFAVDSAFPGYVQAGLLARVAPYADPDNR
jgi:hypothetical protein